MAVQEFRGELKGLESYAAQLQRVLDLLGLQAGDPRLAELATLDIPATALTDAAIVSIAEAQDDTRLWSLLELQFTQTSGRARYKITGGAPTAAGVGLQIPSGGGKFYLRGLQNIRNFRIIAETGELANFSGVLYSAPAFQAYRR